MKKMSEIDRWKNVEKRSIAVLASIQGMIQLEGDDDDGFN